MGTDRRRFIGRLASALGAVGAAPALVAATRERSRDELRRRAADLGSAREADEAFWQLVRDQYPMAPGTIMLNAANLCPSPYPVQETVFALTRDVDRDASFQNRARFADMAQAAREALARYVGADPDEVVITRNTSDGNATVVTGLDLGPGDEVLIWDQNHPTNAVAWEVQARRRGFRVRTVTTPPDATSPDELIDPFDAALTPATRVLAFSHVSNASGVRLPAGEMCRLARSRGVLTLVDGAQTFGALRLDLHAMGCDFYTGSAHKWFTGPKEAGILYVARDRIEGLWPSHVGVGWEAALEAGARKFEVLGQRDDAAVSATGETVRFHETIGLDREADRVVELASTLKHGLRERFPGLRLHTPMSPAASAGVVVFDLPGMNVRDAYGRLYQDHGIAAAARGGDFPGIRLCPHVYTTLDDIQRVIDAVGHVT